METGPFEEALRQALPQLHIRSLRALLDGWDAVVLEVNGELIFRFPRRPEVIAGHQKEITLLPALAKALPCPVPHITYAHYPVGGSAGSFMGYPRLEGEPLSAALFEAPAVAGQLGRFLSALHAFSPEEAARMGAPAFNTCAWRESYRQFYAWAQASALPLLAAEAGRRAARLWEGYLERDENFCFQPALIHGDLGAEHILCDPRRQVVTGVIDWEDASVGDPALDLVGLFALAGRRAVEAVLTSYDLPFDESLWARVAFYTAIIPFHEVRYGLETQQPEFVRRAVSFLNGSRS